MKLTMFNTVRSINNPPTINDFCLDLTRSKIGAPTRYEDKGLQLMLNDLYRAEALVVDYVPYMGTTQGPPVLITAGKVNQIYTNPSTQSPPWKISAYNNSPYWLAWSINTRDWHTLAPYTLVDCDQCIDLYVVAYTKWGGIVSN